MTETPENPDGVDASDTHEWTDEGHVPELTPEQQADHDEMVARAAERERLEAGEPGTESQVAATAEPEPVNRSLKRAELEAVAKTHGIDPKQYRNKDDLADAIDAASGANA